MSSERVARSFGDILAAIDLIETWVAEAGGADKAIFHDLKVRSAIERQLLVVSEAAIRLDKLEPGVAPRLAPDIDWLAYAVSATSSATSMTTSTRRSLSMSSSTGWKLCASHAPPHSRRFSSGQTEVTMLRAGFAAASA